MAVIFKNPICGDSRWKDKRYKKREIKLALLSFKMRDAEGVLRFSHFCGDCA